MPVSHPLAAVLVPACPEQTRDPKPFGGWAMAKAAGLDRAGARGLVADLLTASTLRRQAAFVVLASVPIDEPRCLVAGHSWDRVRWTIEESAWRFERRARPSRPRRS